MPGRKFESHVRKEYLVREVPPRAMAVSDSMAQSPLNPHSQLYASFPFTTRDNKGSVNAKEATSNRRHAAQLPYNQFVPEAEIS